MKVFLFLLFVSFFNFSLSLKANNVNIDDFEIDIKQSLNAVLFAKSGSIDEYNKTYKLINHCKNFEKNDYFKQQFLSGWILLEYLKEPNAALSHFLQLLADFMQTLCFYIGANYVFYGEKLLTADNSSIKRDNMLLGINNG